MKLSISRKSMVRVKVAAVIAFAAFKLGCGGRTGLDSPNNSNPPMSDGGTMDSGTPDAGPSCVPTQYDGGVDGGTQPPQNAVVVAQNLLGDFLDRTLGDRKPDNGSDMNQLYQIGGPDTDPNASPFTNGSGGTIGPSQQFLFRVDSSVAPLFDNQTVTDSDSGNDYNEHQALWMSGDNHYDVSSKGMVGNLNLFAYSMKFDGPAAESVGIPVCTTSFNGDYTACKSNSPPNGTSIDDATENHHIRLSFLGSQWTISQMNAPSGQSLTNDSTLVNGGSIKLAKEAISGILNEGESFPVDNLLFRYDGYAANPNGTGDIAVISILDNNCNILMKDTISVGQTKDYSINGKNYNFHLYKLAPGYNAQSNWIDAAINSNEITLVDGEHLNQDEGNNPGYKVSLGWKNRSPNSGSTQPDTLRTAIIYSDSIDQISSSGSNSLNVGDYISIVQDPGAWQLSYSGLNLSTSDLSTVSFDIGTSDLVLPNISDQSLGFVSCVVHAPYLKVTSSQSGPVFSAVSSDNTTLSDNSLIWGLNNAATCTINSSDMPTVNTLFMRESPSSNVYGLSGGLVNYAGVGGTILFGNSKNGAGAQIISMLQGAGSKCTPSDCLNQLGSPAQVGLPDSLIWISEAAGPAGFSDSIILGVTGSGTGNPSDATFSFDSSDGSGFQTTSSMGLLYGHAVMNGNYAGSAFSGPVSSGMEIVQQEYMTERGSSVRSFSVSSIQLQAAQKLGKAQWVLTY